MAFKIVFLEMKDSKKGKYKNLASVDPASLARARVILMTRPLSSATGSLLFTRKHRHHRGDPRHLQLAVSVASCGRIGCHRGIRIRQYDQDCWHQKHFADIAAEKLFSLACLLCATVQFAFAVEKIKRLDRKAEDHREIDVPFGDVNFDTVKQQHKPDKNKE